MSEQLLPPGLLINRHDRLTASGDITAPKGFVALPAYQVQASEVIPLTQRIRAIGIVHREKFGSDHYVAIL